MARQIKMMNETQKVKSKKGKVIHTAEKTPAGSLQPVNASSTNETRTGQQNQAQNRRQAFRQMVSQNLGGASPTAVAQGPMAAQMPAVNPYQSAAVRQTLPAYQRPVDPITVAAANMLRNNARGNIDLYNRPQYRQPDGSISTVNSISIGTVGKNGDKKETLIPTIGRDKNGRPVQWTDEEAIDHYYKTGENLGKFNTVEEANDYAEKLHRQQEAYYSPENSPLRLNNVAPRPYELGDAVQRFRQTGEMNISPELKKMMEEAPDTGQGIRSSTQEDVNAAADWKAQRVANAEQQQRDREMRTLDRHNPVIAGALQGTGLPSMLTAGEQALARLTGNEEAQKQSAQIYADELREAQGLQARHPLAYNAGNVAGNIATVVGIGKVIGAIPAFANMSNLAQAVVSGAGAMGGTTAIQEAGAASTGMISPKDYALDIATGAGAGAAGGAVSNQIAGAGMNFLRNHGLTGNALAQTVVAGLSSSGYSGAGTAVRQGSAYLRDPENYQFDAEQAAKDAAVAFAFGAFSFAWRNRQNFTMNQEDPNQRPSTKYFDDCKTPGEIDSKLRQYARQYHPDQPNGNADLFAEISAEATAMKAWMNVNNGAQAYQRAQEAYSSGDAAEYQAAQQEYNAAVNALMVDVQSGAIQGNEAVEALQILQSVSANLAGPEAQAPATSGSEALAALADQGFPSTEAQLPTTAGALPTTAPSTVAQPSTTGAEMFPQAQGVPGNPYEMTAAQKLDTAARQLQAREYERSQHPSVEQLNDELNSPFAVFENENPEIAQIQTRTGEQKLAALAAQAITNQAEQKEAQIQAIYEAGKTQNPDFQAIMDRATMLTEAEKTSAFERGLTAAAAEAAGIGKEISYGGQQQEEGNYLSGEGSGRDLSLRAGERDGGVPSEAGSVAEGWQNWTAAADPDLRGGREGAGSTNVTLDRGVLAEEVLRTAAPGQVIYPVKEGGTPKMRKAQARINAYDPDITQTPFVSKGDLLTDKGEYIRAFVDPAKRQIGFRINDEQASSDKVGGIHEVLEIANIDGKLDLSEAEDLARHIIPGRYFNAIVKAYQNNGPTRTGIRHAIKEALFDITAGINQFEGVEGYGKVAQAVDYAQGVLYDYFNDVLGGVFDAEYDETAAATAATAETAAGTGTEATAPSRIVGENPKVDITDKNVSVDSIVPTITEMPKNLPEYSSTLYREPAQKELFTLTKGGEIKVKEKLNMSGRDFLIRQMKEKGYKDKKHTLYMLDKTAELMDKAGAVYKYIGMDDINNVRLVIDPRSGNIVLRALVKNGEYPVNLDLTKECTRRIALGNFIKYLAEHEGRHGGKTMLEEVPLTAKNLVRFNQILKDEGFDTACLGCFVETRRYRIQEWADSFIEKYNRAVEKYNPDAGYYDFSDKDIYVSDMSKQELSELNEALESYKTNQQTDVKAKRERLGQPKTNLTNEESIDALVRSGKAYQKKLRVSDLITPDGRTALHRDLPELESLVLGHYGSNTPKSVELFTPYNYDLGSILSVGNQSLQDYVKPIGGVREQSFSDSVPTHLMDQMEKTADLAVNKLVDHTYTKVPSEVMMLGLTGRKFNMSIMFNIDPDVDSAHAGLRADGSYFIGDRKTSELEAKAGRERTFVQSFPYDMARKIQHTPGYSKNCGMIGVGYSYFHMRKMMDDPEFGQIIGYHPSGMNESLANMAHIDKATSYEPVQNTLRIKGLRQVTGDLNGLPSYASWPIGTKTSDNKMVKKTNITMKDFDMKGKLAKYGGPKTMKMFLSWLEENRLTVDTGKGVYKGNEQHGVGDFPLYADLAKTRNPKKTADNYITWCLENDMLPEFYEFADHDNYFKNLYDFTTYDHRTMKYSPQVPVTMTFPPNFFRLANHSLNQWNNYLMRQTPKEEPTFERMYAEVQNSSKLNLANYDSSSPSVAEDTGIQYSTKIIDKDLIRKLDAEVERGDYIVTYKAMQLIDGDLLPPMAAKVKGEDGIYHLQNASELKAWQMADEDPSNIKFKDGQDYGHYVLNKGDGTTVEAAYNPYEHSSNVVLNDQFESAHRRDNLVTVKCIIPKSEIYGDNRYKAQYAKDSTGVLDWKSGVVAGKLKDNKRQVYLSRYLKPVEIMKESEVAAMWKDTLAGTDVSVPFNVVPPKLLAELEKIGVPIDYEGSPIYKSHNKPKYTEKTDSAGNRLTQAQVKYFRKSKNRDADGNLKPMYHGTARADRVGTVFDPNRATSGPMAYFTDDESIAKNYSKDKADTSLARETGGDYHKMFRVNVGGEALTVDDAWNKLPVSKRVEIRKKAPHITMDDDGEEIIFSQDTDRGLGNFDNYLVRSNGGNYIKALTESWLDDGTLYGEEGRFREVLSLVGLDDVEYLDPDYRDEKVYAVYLNVTKPFDTGNMTKKAIAAIRKKSESVEWNGPDSNVDMWDKTNVSPQQWIERFNDDIKNGTSYVWTQIPDWVTDTLKELGYDGIFDTGGKKGGASHRVVIPFYSEQIKNIDNLNPTTDTDIRYSSKLNFQEQKELDEEYEEALKEDNKDWQMMLVDQAAYNAGYTTPAYHGSPIKDVTVFNTRSEGTGKQAKQLLFGTHFTQSEEYAKLYASKAKNSKGTSRMSTKFGKIYKTYLDLGKSLDLRTAVNLTPGMEEYQLYEDAPARYKKKYPPYTFTKYDTEQGLGSGNYITKATLENVLQAMNPKEATDFLVDHGYNSVLYNADYSTPTSGRNRFTIDPSIIMLDPERIKSGDRITYDDNGKVIPLSERFNAENEDIRYSTKLDLPEKENAPTFYSKLQREIENYKGEKIGAASVESYLKGKGVKDEEIKWSGIRTFLEGKKSVNKAELMDYLKANELQIEEKILGGNVDQNVWSNGYNTVYTDRYYDPVSNAEFKGEDDFRKEAVKRAAEDKIKESEILFNISNDYMSAETEDGEVILEAMLPDVYELRDAEYEPSNGTRWEDYKLDGGKNYREILFSIPGSDYSNQAMQTHWKGDKGVLAHARVQDFDSADGGKVLFVEEIQSDWHNAGQKEGYENKQAELEEERTSELAYKAYDESVKAIEEAGYDGDPGDIYLRYVEMKDDAWDKEKKVIDKKVVASIDKARPIIRDAWAARDARVKESGNVPDAPFRTTYTDYVLKNLLRMAAEGDYDYLAWTTGEMQEERWSDEFAEGYRIEYDQQIPKFLKKYGKQWGAGLTQIALPTSEIGDKHSLDFRELHKILMNFDENISYSQVVESAGDLESDTAYLIDESNSRYERAMELARRLDDAYANGTLYETPAVPAITVNDAMKQSVLTEGQPMYSTKLKLNGREVELTDREEELMEQLNTSYLDRIDEITQQKDAEIAALQEEMERAVGEEKKKARDRLERLRKQKNDRIAYLEKQWRENTNRRIADLKEKAKNKLGEQHDDMMRRLAKLQAQKDKKIEDILAEHRRQRQEARDKRNDHKLRVKFQKLAQRAVRDSKNKPGMASQRVQELLKDIDLKALGMRDETKWELRRKYQEILEMKEKDENYAALFADRDMKKVERLFKTQINEMSVEDINDLITELSALAHYQENTDRLLKDSQGRSAAEVGRQIVKDLKELSPLEVTNPVKRLSAKYLRDNLSPERAFNRLSGYKHDNAMKTFYRTQILDGLTKVKRFEQKADELKQEFINDEKNKYFLNNGSKQTIPVTDKYGRTAMISPAMRVSLYMASKNADNLRHIATDGVTVPEPKTYAKGMIEDAYGRGTTLILDPTDVKAICNGMTDSEKEFATLLKIFFDTYAKDAINETSVDLDGILRATVENYFPITSDKNFLAKSMDSFQDPTLEGWNNLKSRQENANNRILLEDARQVLQRHIRNTARYHGLAVPMRNWSKVYGYTSHRDEATGTRNSVQSAIKNAWDADTADYIERLIRDDINSGGRKAERGIADAMRSAYAGATLTLNPSVALKQTTSYLMAGSILDSGSLMYGLAHGFTKKDEAYMDSITPWGWARRQGESTIELGDLARKMDPITKNTPNWNQAMDVWTTNRLFLATEESVKKEFKASKNEALHDLKRGDKKYDDAVAERYNQVLWRTQPQYEAAFRPEYLRKTDVGSRTFGLFKTESMQMSGELIDAWGQWKADEKRTKDAKGIYDKHPGDQTKTVYETNEKYRKDSAKQFYRTFCSWVASNMLFSIMGTGLNILLLHKGKPYRNDKGEIDWQTIAMKTGQNFIGSSLGGFFYASTAADIGAYLYGKLSGENPTWYDIEVPGISLMNDAVENMGNLTGVLTNEEANNAAKAQAIAKFALAVSKFTPVGFAENIVNLANSVVLYNQDKKEGTLGKWEAGKGLLKDTSPTRDQYANRAVDAARNGDMATAERALKKTKKANLEKAVGRPITENMYKKIMEDPNNLRNYLGVALEDMTPSIKNVPDHGYSSFTKLREDIGDPERTQNWHHIVEQEQMEEGLAGFKSTQVNNTNNIVSIPSGSKSPHSKISEYYGSVQDFTDGKTVREWLKDKSFEEQWEFGVKQLREYGDLVPTTNGWVFVPDKKKMETKIPMEEGKAKEKTDTQRSWESRIAEAREDGSLKDNEIRTIALDMIREGISAEEAEALYRDKKKKEVEKLDKWIEEKGTFEDYLKGRNAISEAAAIKDKDKEKQAEKRKKAVEDYLRQYHGSYANELWLWELAGYSENTFEYH